MYGEIFCYITRIHYTCKAFLIKSLLYLNLAFLILMSLCSGRQYKNISWFYVFNMYVKIASVSRRISNKDSLYQQEAQLPQRDSASASHFFLGSLTDRALH